MSVFIVSLSSRLSAEDALLSFSILPVYRGAYDFSEGLAPVATKQGFGFIDASGKIVIAPQPFTACYAFREGLALVKNADDRWRYMDRNGRVFPQKGFSLAWEFHGGRAAVRTDTGLGYIDTTGKLVIDSRYSDAGEFKDGLASVRLNGSNLYGYIDTNGSSVIPPRFTFASSFSEGLAVVTLDNGKTVVYIDRTGKTILSPGIPGAGAFHEGLAAITADGKTGYIDRTGSVVVKPRYDFGGSFCEGMAAVQKGKKMGFIDRSGSEVIPLEWDEVNNFSEGLARVKKNGKADFIDKTGKIYPLQSDSVYAAYFHEGYAAIPKDIMSWGYVKSPLSKETEAKTVVTGGFCVGSVREIKRGEVIVTGPEVGSLVATGDSLAVEARGGVIVLRAVYPMMASVRCSVSRGSLKDLSPGMKAFRMAQRDVKK